MSNLGAPLYAISKTGASIVWNDDDLLTMGDGDPFTIAWDTTDTNANKIHFSVVQTTNDLPIFVFGEEIIAVDLGLFNGLTQPAVAVIDLDNDSYIKMGFVSDDIAEILSDSPIRITPSTDVHFTDGTGVVIGHTAQTTIGGLLPEAQIVGIDNVAAQLAVVNFAADTQGAILVLGKSRGALGAVGTTIVSGDVLGLISFFGDDGTDLDTLSAKIQVVSTGTIGTGRIPSKIEIYTGTDAAPTVQTLAVTIFDNQNINLAASILSFDGAVTIDSSGNNLIIIDGGTTGVEIVGTIVFNEAGLAAADFRVESNLSTDMIFVDSSGDVVGIATGSPSSSFVLDVNGAVNFVGDITVGDDIFLADGAVIGITGNEIITFNAAGTIVVSGATFTVGGQVIADGSGNLASANGHASFGPSDITTITIVNGIVTAVA